MDLFTCIGIAVLVIATALFTRSVFFGPPALRSDGGALMDAVEPTGSGAEIRILNAGRAASVRCHLIAPDGRRSVVTRPGYGKSWSMGSGKLLVFKSHTAVSNGLTLSCVTKRIRKHPRHS